MTCKLFNILNDEDQILQAQLDAFSLMHPSLYVLVARADDLPYFEMARQVPSLSSLRHLSGVLSPEALEERATVLRRWAEAEVGGRLPLSRQAYLDAGASLSPNAFGDYMLSVGYQKGILYAETEYKVHHCLITLEPRGWGVQDDLALATKIKADRFTETPELCVPLLSLRHELGHVHRCAEARRCEPLFVDERGADVFALSDACGGLPPALQRYGVEWRLINNFCEKLTPRTLSYAFTQTLNAREEPDYDDAVAHMAAMCEVKLYAAPEKLRPEFGVDFVEAPQIAILDTVTNGAAYERVRQHYANVIPQKAEKVLSARLNQLARALDQNALTPQGARLASDVLQAANRRLPQLSR